MRFRAVKQSKRRPLIFNHRRSRGNALYFSRLCFFGRFCFCSRQRNFRCCRRMVGNAGNTRCIRHRRNIIGCKITPVIQRLVQTLEDEISLLIFPGSFLFFLFAFDRAACRHKRKFTFRIAHSIRIPCMAGFGFHGEKLRLTHCRFSAFLFHGQFRSKAICFCVFRSSFLWGKSFSVKRVPPFLTLRCHMVDTRLDRLAQLFPCVLDRKLRQH